MTNMPWNKASKIQAETLITVWLRLHNVPKIGILALKKSAEKLSCRISEIPFKSDALLLSIGWTEKQVSALSANNPLLKGQVRKCLDWLFQSTNHHFISIECKAYPTRLQEISRPPMFLFVAGNLDLLELPQIAFVGSRSASFAGIKACASLIHELAKSTKAITVSGLALGIDAACHQASLRENLPTIGVLGCGIDQIYPKRHKNLYESLIANGAIVSEFIPSTKALAHMFPRRNRIISGLSLGTVVIEAKIKSGSLITAKYALEQNREVFAVPSNINNPNAQGCHWLIKQGAKLTDNIQDIIDEIPEISLNLKNIEKNTSESLASDPLLDSVDYSATSVDTIAERTGRPLNELLIQLLEYELRGLVSSTAEGYIKLGA